MSVASRPPLEDEPRNASGPDEVAHKRLIRERRGLLRTVSAILDGPMTALSFVWLVLLIVEFTGGMTTSLQTVTNVIWVLFVVQFTVEFWIAPFKTEYLRRNWLTAVALVLPAFRLLRAFRAISLLRAARLSRSVRLLRWVTSMNRGMKATRRATRQHKFSYVAGLTVIVCFAGAAGIFVFENPTVLERDGFRATSAAFGIRSYGEAVWWTAMMLTTMGSDYFPRTTEGRIIAWLLAVYAFAIFGYITATVASVIIKVDRNQSSGTTPKTGSVTPLSLEVKELRRSIERIENLLRSRDSSEVSQNLRSGAP